jgi:hypothetical protein
MGNIEELLGKSYAELPHVTVLQGVTIPPLEQIAHKSYVSFLPLGISLVLPDNQTVATVHLHSDQHEGFAGYAAQLPGGISFRMGRSEVRQRLGTPEQSGEETVVPVLGKKAAWDSFRVGGARVHVEYVPGNKAIGLASISRAQPGRKGQ